MQEHDILLCMVPLKLSIKNFLSYGQTTQHISFEPYNLICLSGKNGHGKSALLDALTWALWGQARKTHTGARLDENLVRLGHTQMMVCLEFVCNKTIYRVRRELNIGNTKTQTSLDFGIVDPETGHVRGLTDKTIRATQEKIITTLGLDYESFINSVFLRQGASNEFSKKSPKERKDILSAILGITQFELIKKKAVEKSRALALQKDTLMPIQQRLRHEVAQKNDIQTSLFARQEEELECRHKIDQLQKELALLEEKLHQYKRDTLTLQQYHDNCQKLAQRIEAGKQEIISTRQEFKKILRKKIKPPTDEAIEQEALAKKIATLQKNELLHLQLQQEILKLTQEKQSIFQAHEQVHTKKIHACDIQIEKAQANNSIIEKRIAELNQKKIVLCQTIEKKYGNYQTEKIIRQYEKYRDRYHHFVTKKNNYTSRLHDTQDRLKKLYTPDFASCPTCKQNLDAQQKYNLCTDLKNDVSLITHQLRRLHKLLPPLKGTILTLHDLVESFKDAAHMHKQALEMADELDMLTKEYRSQKDFLENIRLTKKNLLEEAQRLTDDDIRYQKIKAHLYELNDQLIQIPVATQAEKTFLAESLKKIRLNLPPQEGFDPLLQQIKKFIKVTVSHLKSLKHEYVDFSNKASLITQSLSSFESTQERVKKISAELLNFNQKIHTLIGQIASYKEQLARLEVQEIEHARLEKTVQECTYGQELYQTIAQAVGKDGIPALLIEQALPEIEHEANNLLEKLTDNQAHLFIESLRDLKSGKTKETLDIHISDATGVRPYELFSGGEAFRIDFALRIALSKLLARRAGTSLQTLIIDEGFGSQDEEGLAHIMEALYKIQDDFAKIIIVSHLPYMKDQFPVHFVINKTAQGSVVKVIEQG